MTDVLVVAELIDGGLRRNTLTAVTLAKQITAAGGAFDVLAIGEGSKKAAADLAKFGARKVFATEIAGGYVAEKYAPTVADLAKKGNYGVVTTVASTYGKDLMPRVAAKLGAANISDISSASVDSVSSNSVGPAAATQPRRRASWSAHSWTGSQTARTRKRSRSSSSAGP